MDEQFGQDLPRLTDRVDHARSRRAGRDRTRSATANMDDPLWLWSAATPPKSPKVHRGMTGGLRRRGVYAGVCGGGKGE
jgi:hypothetical protein